MSISYTFNREVALDIFVITEESTTDNWNAWAHKIQLQREGVQLFTIYACT